MPTTTRPAERATAALERLHAATTAAITEVRDPDGEHGREIIRGAARSLPRLANAAALALFALAHELDLAADVDGADETQADTTTRRYPLPAGSPSAGWEHP